MSKYNEIKAKLRTQLENDFNKFKEQEINIFMDYLMQLNLETENKKVSVPNDMVVLSANAFSRIVNMLSVAEGQGLIEDDIVADILDDIQKTRKQVESIPSNNSQTYEYIRRVKDPYKQFMDGRTSLAKLLDNLSSNLGK